MRKHRVKKKVKKKSYDPHKMVGTALNVAVGLQGLKIISKYT